MLRQEKLPAIFVTTLAIRQDGTQQGLQGQEVQRAALFLSLQIGAPNFF